MIQVEIDILLNGPREMIGSLQWVYKQSGEIVMSDGSKKSQVVTISDLSPSCQNNFNKKLNKYNILTIPIAVLIIPYLCGLTLFELYKFSNISYYRENMYLYLYYIQILFQ